MLRILTLEDDLSNIESIYGRRGRIQDSNRIFLDT